MIIYKTTNLVNGKIYVGQTTINNKRYIGSGLKLQAAIKKYGRQNFVRENLCECSSQEELNEKEQHWIKELNSKDEYVGYNIDNGGNSFGRCADETKKKISDKIKAKWMDKEYRTKGENRIPSFLGKHHSKETREKLSKIHKGKKCPWSSKPRSIETKEKIREKLTGVPFSEERKRNISTKTKQAMGTKEMKEKLRNGKLDRVWICKDDKTKMIRPDELTEYTNGGWLKGRKGKAK